MVQRAFFDRFGHHGICVLPLDVLSDDPLTDPDTREELPSLRRHISLVSGTSHTLLCYAGVFRTCGDGLYWADVAATPDFANTQRVVLTEEDLYAALPWDVRVQRKSPAQLLKLMALHACEVRPLQRVEPAYEPTPAPVLPLTSVATVEVSNEELQEAIADVRKETKHRTVSKFIGTFHMQQALLQAMIDTLMEQLYQAKDHLSALALKPQCATIAVLQRWHRQHRQRVVNAVRDWCNERQAVVWQLTVGVPASVRAAA